MSFPRDGTVVSISHNGRFIGGINTEGKELPTVGNLGGWEGFAIEHDHHKFALRQVDTGLYIGGRIQDDKHPELVKKRNDWEIFTLEPRGFNAYAIRSHQNTYLTLHHEKLVWKTNPHNGNEVWQFKLLIDSPHDFKQGFSRNGNEGQSHAYLNNWFANIGKQLFSQLPTNGEQILITRNGHYIGCTRNQGETVKLAGGCLANEQLVAEALPDGKFGIKQKVSGLYLGGQIHNNKKPQWVPVLNDWEKFTFETRQNGQVVIKSFANTYLTQDGEELIWKDQSGDHQLFKFVYPNRAPVGQGFGGNHLPVVGNLISINQGNHHIGGIKEQNTNLKLVEKAQAWEYFLVESAPNGKVSLKQEVSGLYLGGAIHNDKHPSLVPHAKEWEHFTLESRGAGGFAIKSHADTFLELHNGHLVWKSHPQGGKQVWSFQVHNQHQNQGFGSGFQGGYSK